MHEYTNFSMHFIQITIHYFSRPLKHHTAQTPKMKRLGLGANLPLTISKQVPTCQPVMFEFLMVVMNEMMVHGVNHLLGYEATLQRPQVFPLASLTKPFSPQVVPQEFLTHQQASVTPTKTTPWLREVLQLLKTPDLQGDQLLASTAMEMGLPVTAVAKSLQFLTSVKPEILKGPVFCEQVCLTALQGYWLSKTIPLSLTNLKALSIRPPLQAWFPYEPEQSTSCCSEKFWRSPKASLERPSRPPVAEKAQHDPHCPWFLTSVTAPWETQSTSPTLRSSTDSTLLEDSTTVPRQVWANSSVVRPENWLRPISQVLNSLELWEFILARFSRKILSLQAFSNSEAYLMLCLPFHDSNSETVEDCCTFRRTAAAPMTAMRTASCFPFIQFIMNLVTLPLYQYPQVGFLITPLKKFEIESELRHTQKIYFDIWHHLCHYCDCREPQ